MTLDESVINENDQIWAGDPRDLAEKLDRYYGVDGLELYPDFYDGDEYHYDVLGYSGGESPQFIAADVPMLGHGPSGAVGVDPDGLPEEDRVKAVVEGGDGA